MSVTDSGGQDGIQRGIRMEKRIMSKEKNKALFATISEQINSDDLQTFNIACTVFTVLI